MNYFFFNLLNKPAQFNLFKRVNTNKLVNNIFNSDNTHYLTLIGLLGTFGTYIYLLENNKNIKYNNIKYKNIKYNDNYKEYIIKYE